MSKTDPSSSNAAGTDWPGRADGDAGRQSATLAEQPEAPTRPTRDVDDSWALSAAMPVPNVPGLSEIEQPAPPLIPAAAPTGHGSGREAAASVVARAAALRAMGAKTMQGVGPAPINRAQKLSEAVAAAARQVAAETAAANAAVADLEEEPTHFTNAPSSSSAAASAAVAELVAEAPTHHAPAASVAAAQAPLYLDDPPDMLRLSTGTSDISVPEIDPGVSAVMSPGGEADDGHEQSDDGGYSSDSAPYPAEASEPFPHDDGYSASEEGHGDGHEHAAEDESGEEDEHDGHDDTRDDVGYQSAGDVGYGHSAPEAMPPAAQLVAPTTAALRAYGSDGVPRATSSDWFEPSGGHAQQIADAAPYGHTSQQHDFSFTEPSRRRNRPPGPNRWIAPVAVVVALAAVVFAGGYFYTRGSASKAATETAASSSNATGAVASGDPSAAGTAGGADQGAAAGAASAAGAAASGEGDNAAAPSSTVAAGLVDVRFDSNPPGAMVMLVDRGRGVTSPVGTTPVRAALEPKGTYDAIFTLEGHPTKVISLAGPKSARVVANLSGAEQVATAPVPAANAGDPATAGATQPADEKSGQVAAADDKAAQQADRPDKRDNKSSSRKDKRKNGRPVAAGGNDSAEEGDEGDEPDNKGGAADGAMGSLSISAKPACEIAINGKSIGRSTPVRDFPLSVGIHKITFINKSIGVNETIAVRVTAGKETKVAQDYTGTP